MVLLDELRVTMSDYRKDLKELYEVLGIEKAQARYDALQKQVADPDFYSDLENSQKVLQEVKSLENRIEKYQKMEETLDDILTLIELTMEEGEEESNAELNEEADKFVKELESLKLASLLTGEYDSSNAILTFHAGAGGTEAQDWAEMLYRMYNRWAERHNFKAELLDYLDGDEAGLKSASIMISGDNAYGIPTLGVVAVGKQMARNPQFFSLATRVIAELGAQLVKCYYCEDFEKITAGCPVPIVVAGGKKLPIPEALSMAYHAISEGAHGMDMGRNIFQAEDPKAMAQAVAKIVHEGFTDKEAYEFYRDTACVK